MTSTFSAHDGDVVEIRVPAQAGYVATVRLAAAGLAARADLTVDDIEDLRLAVDEACSLLLTHATEGATLDAHFVLAPGSLAVSVAIATTARAELNRTSFAWTVLEALTTSADIDAQDDRVTVVLTKRREVTHQ